MSEGGFFILLILFGLYLIYRTLRQQVELKHQFRDFYAGFSHELKTPIASMKLQAETLHARDLPKGQARHLLENMLDDLERLELAIENILDAFRFESHRISLDFQTTEIDSWIRRKIEKISIAYADRDLELKLDLDSGACVNLDGRLFESVLANIMQNSVRYADGKPSLTVTTVLDRERNEVRISFADEGIGIERDGLERIFEKYHRIRDEDGMKWKGAGLGLFLAREIVRVHRGRIWAESEGAERGTTVVITLPVES
jgi:signal transduction histidine kinase